MAMFFWHLLKGDLASVRYYTLDTSRFFRYQKQTAMYSLSPCIARSGGGGVDPEIFGFIDQDTAPELKEMCIFYVLFPTFCKF